MASTGRKKIVFCPTVVFIDKLHKTDLYRDSHSHRQTHRIDLYRDSHSHRQTHRTDLYRNIHTDRPTEQIYTETVTHTDRPIDAHRHSLTWTHRCTDQHSPTETDPAFKHTHTYTYDTHQTYFLWSSNISLQFPQDALWWFQHTLDHVPGFFLSFCRLSICTSTMFTNNWGGKSSCEY